MAADATFDNCASECDTLSGCTAYEYESSSKTCRVHNHSIAAEKQQTSKDKQQAGWQTCVKVESSCDEICGCGWYRSEKNLNAQKSYTTITEIKQDDTITGFNYPFNKYPYAITSAKVCRPAFNAMPSQEL